MYRGSPTRFLFVHVGLPHRWLTNNPLWRSSVREMARHFPPGGATLTVLDLNCGPGNLAFQLLDYRPDLRVLSLDFSAKRLRIARQSDHSDCTAWAQADICQLPIASNSVDAITAHSVFHSIPNRAAFLRESLRVLRPGGRLIMLDPIAGRYPWHLLTRAWRSRAALWILVWRAFSQQYHRFTLEEMSTTLTESGLARVLTERAVDGYGIVSRGEKPYTQLSTVERIAQTAARDDIGSELQIADAADLTTASRGKFVFLLVRQTPDKPVWAIQPDEILHWQAAMVNSQEGQPYLLAFTSLSKAVEFMQAAVMANYLHGINKVAKFDKAVALAWSADILLNPPFEALSTSDRFAAKGVMLDVVPSSAVTGEE